jgi:hypothetical protein
MGKPEFNPNIPFEVVESEVKSSKPPFDPNAPFENVSQIQANEIPPWYYARPEMLLQGFAEGLNKIDQYTGAPVRKFATELVTGQNLEQAPTGSEQAAMMGAPTTTYGEAYGVPSYLGGTIAPSDIYGLGLNVVQDPTMLISPVLKGAKAIIPSFEKGMSAINKFGSKVGKGIEGAYQSFSDAPPSLIQDMPLETQYFTNKTSPITMTGEIGPGFEFNKPQSLDEINSWTAPEGTGVLPGKERLKQIELNNPDLASKPLDYHYAMYEHPKAMRDLKNNFENLPSESRIKIGQYNQSILDDSIAKSKEAINSINQGKEPLSIPQTGSEIIDSIKIKYNTDKKALGPLFQKFQQLSMPLDKGESINIIHDIISKTKASKLLNYNAEIERLMLKPNVLKSGLSDAEYKAFSRTLHDFNDGISFQEIQNIRDGLRKMEDPINAKSTEEISKLRTVLLDTLESMAEVEHPTIRETFRSYAINERSLNDLEKIIGGNVENLNKIYNANPDKVINKLISNPNYIQIAKDYLGQDKINEIIAAKINEGFSQSFNSIGEFKPHTFQKFLNTNRNLIDRELSPEIAQRLKDMADLGYFSKRFMDLANPSGTAASLAQMISPKKSIISMVTSPFDTVVEGGSNFMSQKLKEKESIKFVNEAMISESVPKVNIITSKLMNGTLKLEDFMNGVKNFQLTQKPFIYPLNDQDLSSYVEDIKNDTSLSIIDKANERSRVNKDRNLEINPKIKQKETPQPFNLESIGNKLRGSR